MYKERIYNNVIVENGTASNLHFKVWTGDSSFWAVTPANSLHFYYTCPSFESLTPYSVSSELLLVNATTTALTINGYGSNDVKSRRTSRSQTGSQYQLDMPLWEYGGKWLDNTLSGAGGITIAAKEVVRLKFSIYEPMNWINTTVVERFKIPNGFPDVNAIVQTVNGHQRTNLNALSNMVKRDTILRSDNTWHTFKA